MNGKRAKVLRAGVGYNLSKERNLHPDKKYRIEKHEGGTEPDKWIAYQLWCRGKRSWYKLAKKLWKEGVKEGRHVNKT